ncbi:MAG: omptin family outer membrane protease [Lentisphaerae bacterium]|nr:omptin family outer membrane protease [Lentisphaerota bacterium]
MKGKRVVGLFILALLTFTLMLPTGAGALHAYDGPQAGVLVEEGPGFSVSFRGSAGLLHGKSHELVYADLPGGGRHKLSQLIWDFTGIGLIGGVGSAKIGKIVSLNAGLWTKVGKGSGEMYDYDWIIPGQDWTHRSRSEVDLLTGIIADVNGTLSWPIQNFSVRGIMGGKINYWKWTDRGQEYTYSVNGFRDTQGTFGGENVIDYSQTWIVPYMGLGAEAVWNPVELNVYSVLGTTVATDNDHHKKRMDYGPGGIRFLGSFAGGAYVGMGGTATWNITDWLFVSASSEMQYMPIVVGSATIVEANATIPNGAGVSHWAVTGSGSAGVRF